MNIHENAKHAERRETSQATTDPLERKEHRPVMTCQGQWISLLLPHPRNVKSFFTLPDYQAHCWGFWVSVGYQALLDDA